MSCPNCGTPTPNYMLHRTNGDSIFLDDTWCAPCTVGKVQQARAALDVCRCAQYPEPHRHQYPGVSSA